MLRKFDEFFYKTLGTRLITVLYFIKKPKINKKTLSYRIYQISYTLKYGDIPWLTQEANSILLGTLRPWMKGFEWGSGKSTLFFARRVNWLVSIEHDYYWYNLVRSWLDREHLHNCDLRYIPSEQHYVECINEFSDEYFDFILIDGILREKRLFKALPKLKRGGFLIFDNVETYGSFLDSLALLRSLIKIETSNGITKTNFYVKPKR
jgi:hypothetical protein